MQQLIKITKQEIGTEFTNSINSRELYEFLNISTAYSHWIQRAILKYDFLENIDFVKIDKPINNQKDYIVTLDMAKELCMVSNTVKGKEVRRYFISCEKELLNQKLSNNDLEKILSELKKQKQELKLLRESQEIKLDPHSHNAFFEIIFQMESFKQDLEVIEKLCKEKKSYIENQFNIFKKHYPKSKKYIESFNGRRTASLSNKHNLWN